MAVMNLKFVNSIAGNFIVPDYQRGYRWTQKEVSRLLEDVYNLVDKDKKYCLQPIVVKNLGENNFEVIDGQQRLTTLFLIYNFMYKNANGFIEPPQFSLRYNTRLKSADFLADIDFSQRETNIDFWFMANVYETIEKWFGAKGKKSIVMPAMMKILEKKIQIIWYEVDAAENSTELFKRLNIGKIPLTNAELVKAMFLSRSNENIDERKQNEIALQWDNLEKELHSDSLWYFLTNNSPEDYQTRIDLVLDLIAGKNFDKDEYATFFYFEGLKAREKLDRVWQRIRKTFLLLKDWHEHHNFYHQIGYLIASGYKNLAAIYEESQGKNLGEFSQRLKQLIRDSVRLSNGESYSDWTYENNKEQIRRLLLLFNVESVRQNSNKAYWFPFDKFKFVDEQKNRWSLEHIHAVQSQEKGTKENWREWLKLHRNSLEALAEDNSDLIAEINRLLKIKDLRHGEFVKLQEKIIQKFSPSDGTEDYINSIANLALIKCVENSALSNSTFDVKRNAIIEMDMRGEFIPFCTKLAFLKYYTKSEKNQLHFWSQADRDAYIAAINSTLKEYLPEKI